jgi:hypothetical protein
MAQKEQQKGQEQLISLIGQISLAWSSLEDDLVYLLSAILATKDRRVLGAVFHATTNIEVKLAMVDESFQIIAPTLPQAKLVSQAWKRLHRRIRNQKATRNAAVHGSLIMAYGTLCLAPPSFSPRFWRQFTQKKERIGVSAHEIQQAIKSIEKIREATQQIAKLIWFWRERNMTAYAKILRSV